MTKSLLLAFEDQCLIILRAIHMYVVATDFNNGISSYQ